MNNFVFDEVTGLLKRIAVATEVVSTIVQNEDNSETTNVQNIIKNIDNSINKIINNNKTTLTTTKSNIKNKSQKKEDKEDTEQKQKEAKVGALRDSKGRFIKKNVDTAKEKADAQKQSKDDKEQLDINVDVSKLEDVAEVMGGMYYKSYQELKEVGSKLVGFAKSSIVGAIKVKDFLFKARPKSNIDTKGETASNERDEDKKLKAEEEENKLLKRLGKGSTSIFSKLFSAIGMIGGAWILKNGKQIFTKLGGIFTSVGKFGTTLKEGFVKFGSTLKDNIAKLITKINPFSSKPKIEPKTTAKTSTKTAAKTTAKASTKTAAKVGAKTTAKVGAKFGLKSLLKKIPILGLLIGGGLAIDRLRKGDTTGAGLEALSGLLAMLPFIGTAGSLATDGLLLKRDLSGESAKAENDYAKKQKEIKEKTTDKLIRIEKKDLKKPIIRDNPYIKKQDISTKSNQNKPRLKTPTAKALSQTIVQKDETLLKEIKKQTELLKTIANGKASKPTTVNYTPQKEALRGVQ